MSQAVSPQQLSRSKVLDRSCDASIRTEGKKSNCLLQLISRIWSYVRLLLSLLFCCYSSTSSEPRKGSELSFQAADPAEGISPELPDLPSQNLSRVAAGNVDTTNQVGVSDAKGSAADDTAVSLLPTPQATALKEEISSASICSIPQEEEEPAEGLVTLATQICSLGREERATVDVQLGRFRRKLKGLGYRDEEVLEATLYAARCVGQKSPYSHLVLACIMESKMDTLVRIDRKGDLFKSLLISLFTFEKDALEEKSRVWGEISSGIVRALSELIEHDASIPLRRYGKKLIRTLIVPLFNLGDLGIREAEFLNMTKLLVFLIQRDEIPNPSSIQVEGWFGQNKGISKSFAEWLSWKSSVVAVWGSGLVWKVGWRDLRRALLNRNLREFESALARSNANLLPDGLELLLTQVTTLAKARGELEWFEKKDRLLEVALVDVLGNKQIEFEKSKSSYRAVVSMSLLLLEDRVKLKGDQLERAIAAVTERLESQGEEGRLIEQLLQRLKALAFFAEPQVDSFVARPNDLFFSVLPAAKLAKNSQEAYRFLEALSKEQIEEINCGGQIVGSKILIILAESLTNCERDASYTKIESLIASLIDRGMGISRKFTVNDFQETEVGLLRPVVFNSLWECAAGRGWENVQAALFFRSLEAVSSALTGSSWDRLLTQPNGIDRFLNDLRFVLSQVEMTSKSKGEFKRWDPQGEMLGKFIDIMIAQKGIQLKPLLRFIRMLVEDGVRLPEDQLPGLLKRGFEQLSCFRTKSIMSPRGLLTVLSILLNEHQGMKYALDCDQDKKALENTARGLIRLKGDGQCFDEAFALFSLLLDTGCQIEEPALSSVLLEATGDFSTLSGQAGSTNALWPVHLELIQLLLEKRGEAVAKSEKRFELAVRLAGIKAIYNYLPQRVPRLAHELSASLKEKGVPEPEVAVGMRLRGNPPEIRFDDPIATTR